ncbi:YeiH family protein [Ignavigranum ruoffiae]|uniref:Conserved hypothetical integral membrane protein n=1 Tax=Ignavigranum ruoffiae TaxID=89093 RepID=A0A1H9H3L6_9LACT|nr:YeiH family protein [Ignavigranum ruoffiae]SEQ56935.1 conserved hypothetical integral membrane protein [Ignavigranum ruoffiae]
MNTFQLRKLAPGISIALLFAIIAKFLESLLPIPLVSASVIALFLGILFNYFRKKQDILDAGIRFTSKRLLKFAIVLLGASLNITTIFNVGKLSLSVLFFTLFTCFGGGYFIGKFLGLDWKLSNLISAGTGICGGSAIAAIAPVIDADDLDIAYALSATFIFDMFMIIAFPIMGRYLNLSNLAYGLWTGTAVNDTSSVVAAGYAFSEAAGDFATTVKLTRTLVIIPTVVVFSIIQRRITKNQNPQSINVSPSFPWFIIGFLVMAFLNSLGFIPYYISNFLKVLSKFLMVAALASIGLNTSAKEMKQAGFAPMLHGFIISTLVIVVAILVEYSLGLI